VTTLCLIVAALLIVAYFALVMWIAGKAGEEACVRFNRAQNRKYRAQDGDVG
jgi:hypothetical protein